jgi:predicted aconitase with swiveling domain
LDVAGTALDMRVSAAVTNEDLTFTGSVNVEEGTLIDPLADLIGPGVLAVAPRGGRVTIQTNFVERTILFDLQTMATLELGLLNLSVTPLIAVRTEFGGGRPAITLVGTIAELEVDFFDKKIDLGEAGAIVIAASTEAIEAYEIDGDGDPETPGDVYDIPRGLTLIARGELTPLVALFEEGTNLNADIMVNVKSFQNVELAATINSNF